MRKKRKAKLKCSICGYPDVVSYKEENPETGELVTRTHEVPCLGHIGIHPRLWNMSARNVGQEFIRSPVYEDFKKARARAAARAGARRNQRNV